MYKSFSFHDPAFLKRTSSLAPLYLTLISSSSNLTDACQFVLGDSVWVDLIDGSPGNELVLPGATVYVDSGGVIPFGGDGNFYKMQVDLSDTAISVTVNGSGIVGSVISVC
jgi:hypothetical protein